MGPFKTSLHRNSSRKARPLLHTRTRYLWIFLVPCAADWHILQLAVCLRSAYSPTKERCGPSPSARPFSLPVSFRCLAKCRDIEILCPCPSQGFCFFSKLPFPLLPFPSPPVCAVPAVLLLGCGFATVLGLSPADRSTRSPMFTGNGNGNSRDHQHLVYVEHQHEERKVDVARVGSSESLSSVLQSALAATANAAAVGEGRRPSYRFS